MSQPLLLSHPPEIDYEEIGLKLREEESVDGVRTGTPMGQVKKLLGKASDVDKSAFWAARFNRLATERWQYFNKDNELTYELYLVKFSQPTVDYYVESVVALTPSGCMSARGVGVGSTYETVLEAYKAEVYPKKTDNEFIWLGGEKNYFVFSFNNGVCFALSMGRSLRETQSF